MTERLAHRKNAAYRFSPDEQDAPFGSAMMFTKKVPGKSNDGTSAWRGWGNSFSKCGAVLMRDRTGTKEAYTMFRDISCLRGRMAALVILLSGTFLLAACGGSDTSDTQRVDGDGVADPATGYAPSLSVDGLSVPFAPGADAVSTSESGPLKTVLYIVPLDRQSATIAFYDQWTEAEPDTYLRTKSANGGVSWQTDSAAVGDKVIISVLSPLAGDDFISVSISAGSVE